MEVVSPKIFLDLETSGLDAWRDKIYICGLLDEDNVYTAVREPEKLKYLLSNTYINHDIVGHRTDFDIKFLEVQWGMEFNQRIHDTRIIGSLLRNRVPKTFLDQYEIMRREKNKTMSKGETYRKGSPLSLKVMAPWYLKITPFWETPGNYDNEEYNYLDLLYTKGLWNLLAPKLRDEGSWDFYEKRMLEWTKMSREMETTGIAISMNELDSVEKEYSEQRDLLKKKLDRLWMGAHHAYRFKQENELLDKYQQMAAAQVLKGKDPEKTRARYLKMYQNALPKMEMQINYSSPTQMAWLLRDHLGLNIVDPDGDESTGKAVLNQLASEGREDIKTFLDWRSADKVLTMYVPTYRELQVDSIIHPSFNITGTRTGRTSSSAPNLQQVPPKLYRLFRPRIGKKYVQFDLAGIEAALIALYSGDKTIYDILANNDSIHDHNVHTLLPLFGLAEDYCKVSDVAEKLPKQRKCVKNIGFAVFYGAGWRRISQVFAAGGFPITDAQAKHGLSLLKKKYPTVFEFHREITEVFESGETVRNLFGRPVTMQAHENPYMQGFNTLIQSSASDLNLEGCRRAWIKNPRAKPLLIVHDFILQEADADHAKESAKILTECMTGFKLESVNGIIKLKVEGGVSDSWDK